MLDYVKIGRLSMGLTCSHTRIYLMPQEDLEMITC
jgi:hypothetical protein